MTRRLTGALVYGERLSIRDVAVSLHPTGHILGSAQVRLEYRGEVWVVSGDDKLAADPTCQPFEPVECDLFVTESTFGLPIFRWPSQEAIFHDLATWWQENARTGRASVVFAYALGKTQHLLSGLDPTLGPIYCHGAVQRVNAAYRRVGVRLPEAPHVGAVAEGNDWAKALIVAPPSARATPWLNRFGDFSSAFVSGWMQVRGIRRPRVVHRGLVLSDHGDWHALLQAIDATGAARVLVTHGFVGPLVRWINERGLDAAALSMCFEGDLDENAEAANSQGILGVKDFAALYRSLDETTKTTRKLAAMRDYFLKVDPVDAAWAVYFLSGRKPKRLVLARDLCQWCMDQAGVPEWLFNECYEAVGDLAETVALLLTEPTRQSERSLHEWVEDKLLGLRNLPPAQQRAPLIAAWGEMDCAERLVWNKLLTGEFRVGVSQSLVIKALAQAANLPATVIAHRLMGRWEPTAEFFRSLLAEATADADHTRPYPFCLSHPLAGSPETLGSVEEWLAEWKWDGIRALKWSAGGADDNLVSWRGTDHRTVPRAASRGGDAARWHGTRRCNYRLEGRKCHAVWRIATQNRSTIAQQSAMCIDPPWPRLVP